MNKPKILFYDIETSPLVCYTWNRYPDHGVIKVLRESTIMSVSFKFLGDAQVRNINAQFGFEAALIYHARKILNTADIVVAHNGDKFDNLRMASRALLNGLLPEANMTTVDTLKAAKKYFSFSSNSLNELGKMLGVGEKVKHEGIDLWDKCLNGDARAWARMIKYNNQDVRLLERVYLRMRPYIQNHPNVAKLMGEGGCGKCGGPLVKSDKLFATPKTAKPLWECKACGGWERS